MSQHLLRWLALGGVALTLAGIVITLLAGGWAATGLGTDHSGTPAGIIGAVLTGWGVGLTCGALITSFFMVRSARQR